MTTTHDNPTADATVSQRSVDHAPIDLCCLVWAHPDREGAVAEYEDLVLGLLPDHGGKILARAIGPGLDGTPHETQFIRLPSHEALDAYLGDPRRDEFSAERDRLIKRTVVYPVRYAENH